jgi:hypothetical protein
MATHVPAEQLARQWFGERGMTPGLSKRCGHISESDVRSLASLIERVRRDSREPVPAEIQARLAAAGQLLRAYRAIPSIPPGPGGSTVPTMRAIRDFEEGADAWLAGWDAAAMVDAVCTECGARSGNVTGGPCALSPGGDGPHRFRQRSGQP